jgi:two-component system chemotaxis response regulator CheY
LTQARVLIVEDDKGIRDILRLAIESDGYRVRVAVNGSEALEVLEHESAELIVLDVRMPVMDGFEFARRYRAGGGRAPLVVLTAAQELAEAQHDFAGARFIEKPFDLDRLMDAIAAAAGPEASA